MPYFSDQYSKLSFPTAVDTIPGFRDAQRGALFAIGSHFTARKDPAIITMPTGSGKTAVLQACPFLLRANRVLVLTPSRLVREQIAEDFRMLGVLKRLGALPADLTPPSILVTSKRVAETDDWERMRDHEVIVATVQSISPHLHSVPPPPIDLFDLILVDEAHHSPAESWVALLAKFSEAKTVLFTATPFRRDNREIKGRFVYSYDLKRAYQDGIFGHIEYQEVTVPHPDDTSAGDVAVAQAAARQLTTDRDRGFDHLLMVRTDSRARATELASIYRSFTSLRLNIIQSTQSLAHVRKVLAALKANELDGIICVNMLGEGFDLPRLKIAAIHSPHRSLAVTLQFIGRFARTAGHNLGQATFLATRSSIKIEAEKLYTSGAVWSEIVPNLSETRVRRELEVRERLDSFAIEKNTSPDLSDLSLYTLSPYAHVKIFKLTEPLEIRKSPEFGTDREQVFGRVSEETQSAVYITKQTSKVGWSSNDALIDIRYDLFVFIYASAANLLFICASKRADGLYRRIAKGLVGYDPKILSLSRINRTLRDLQSARFFNVGMRNRQHSSLTESYRILAGSRADQAIREDDARLFHRGHCFGSAIDDGVEVTIGLSSASKIWSNTSLGLSDLINWCAKLANKISDDGQAVTGSKLDLLQMGEPVDRIPSVVRWADWDKDIYMNPPIAHFTTSDQSRKKSLLDFDLMVTSSNANEAILCIATRDFATKIRFSMKIDGYYEYCSPSEPRMELSYGRDAVDLVEYIKDNPLSLMLDDWSRLCADEYFAQPAAKFDPFDPSQIRIIDWIGNGVDPTKEYGGRNGRVLPNSIQVYLSHELKRSAYSVVYWDHGSGEVADFVALRDNGDNGIDVILFHCKGASGVAAGNRVGDVYEVCGQAVKSAIWCDLPRLCSRLIERFNRSTGVAKFICGDEQRLLDFADRRPVHFEMVVVQPGITRSRIEPKIGEVLASANTHLIRAGHRQLQAWGSA